MAFLLPHHDRTNFHRPIRQDEAVVDTFCTERKTANHEWMGEYGTVRDGQFVRSVTSVRTGDVCLVKRG